MGQGTFHFGKRRLDFDLWALPDFDYVVDFDLVAEYAIQGTWNFIPKEYLSEETREQIEGNLQDQDSSWAGIIVGLALVLVVNVVGATLFAAGTYFANPWVASIGSALLALPDLLLFKVGYEIGDYFWG